MPTAQTIFTQAWIELGVGSPGESPAASDSANGLVVLNRMLDSWSGVRDLVYAITDSNYTLTAAQSFSIGPTAAAPFNVARPIKIENAQILITVGSKVLSFDLDIVGQSEWQSIDDKGATGTVPKTLFYDPQVPNGVLNLHPIPLAVATTQLDLGVWTVVGQFALLSTNINLPPTYLRAITLGLEMELAPTYGNLVNGGILQLRQSQFKEAIEALRSLNVSVQQGFGAAQQAQQNVQQAVATGAAKA